MIWIGGIDAARHNPIVHFSFFSMCPCFHFLSTGEAFLLRYSFTVKRNALIFSLSIIPFPLWEIRKSNHSDPGDYTSKNICTSMGKLDGCYSHKKPFLYGLNDFVITMLKTTIYSNKHLKQKIGYSVYIRLRLQFKAVHTYFRLF